MSLAKAKRLAPYSGLGSKKLRAKTFLSGTNFQEVDFSDIAKCIENHPGYNMQLGVLESGMFCLGGVYIFPVVEGLIGVQATRAVGMGLLAKSGMDWAGSGFKVTPRGLGQFMGGLPAGTFERLTGMVRYSCTRNTGGVLLGRNAG